MNLNLDDKVILITEDQRGICQHIFNVLTQEGAQPFIVNPRDLKNFEGYQIDAFVKISDEQQHALMPFEALSLLNQPFKTPFIHIHIKPEQLFRFKLETDTPLHFNTSACSVPQPLCTKTNTIVYSTSFEHNSVNTIISEIAHTTAFLLSPRSKPMKHQTIFIGKGLEIPSHNHLWHRVNQA